MSSTCSWKHYLLNFSFQFQWSSSRSYLLQREHIHVILFCKTLYMPCLWYVVNLPLCCLHLLPFLKRSVTIPIENQCVTTTASTTPTDTSTTDITRTSNISFWFGIRGSILIWWCFGLIPLSESEEICGMGKSEIYSISYMVIENNPWWFCFSSNTCW